MNLFKTTKDWTKYWQERKIDWVASYQNYDHPHRLLLCAALNTLKWTTLYEVGCASGANLIAIVKNFQGKVLGGCDISEDAIATVTKTMTGGIFNVGSVTDIMMSDKSTDIVLSDMCLIYVDKSDIHKAIEEIKRITVGYAVFCEFHHLSWIKRLYLKWSTGYNAYNYRALLEKHNFYDIQIFKIPEQFWPGGQPQKDFGYIIVAKAP